MTPTLFSRSTKAYTPSCVRNVHKSGSVPRQRGPLLGQIKRWLSETPLEQLRKLPEMLRATQLSSMANKLHTFFSDVQQHNSNCTLIWGRSVFVYDINVWCGYHTLNWKKRCLYFAAMKSWKIETESRTTGCNSINLSSNVAVFLSQLQSCASMRQTETGGWLLFEIVTIVTHPCEENNSEGYERILINFIGWLYFGNVPVYYFKIQTRIKARGNHLFYDLSIIKQPTILSNLVILLHKILYCGV